VLTQSFKLAAIGSTIGIVLALGLSRFMAAHMEMLKAFDPLAYRSR
jgi:hypothetical protein